MASPTPEVDLERGVAGGQLGVAQVDHHPPHAELVSVLEVEHGRRAVVAFADAAVEVDPGRRHDARRQGERDRGQDQPADRLQEGTGEYSDTGADDEAGHHGLAAGRGRPCARDGEQEATDEHPDAERRALCDLAGLAARAVPGDKPPDKDACGDQKCEGDDNACHEKPAPDKKGPADEQQHHHPRDHEPAVAALGGDRRGVVAARHEQQGRDVQQHAHARDERQDDRADAEEDGVDLEVAAKTAAHAADQLVVGRAHQAARGRGSGRVCLVHVLRVPPGERLSNWESSLRETPRPPLDS